MNSQSSVLCFAVYVHRLFTYYNYSMAKFLLENFPNLIKCHYFCSTSGEEEEKRSSVLFKAIKCLLCVTISAVLMEASSGLREHHYCF